MVPTASFVTVAISGLVSVSLPVLLCVICCRRRRNAWKSVLAGAACFIVGAMVLESLCHQLVFAVFPSILQVPVFYAAYGCLAAGLFEETARLIGLRFLCRKEPGPLTGFAYGVGHGGVEAVMIAGLGSVNNLATMAMLNSQGAEALLAGIPAELQGSVQAQLDTLIAASPTLFLASGVERAISLCLHIALSMVIWMVVTKKLPAWGYLAAVALHAGMDVFAILYQLGVIQNIWLTELAIAFFTALVVCGVWRVFKKVRVSN